MKSFVENSANAQILNRFAKLIDQSSSSHKTQVRLQIPFDFSFYGRKTHNESKVLFHLSVPAFFDAGALYASTRAARTYLDKAQTATG